MIKIIIDAGHGGEDPGAIANNLQEKNITLLVSKYMQDYLDENYTDHEVTLTRSTDVYIDLSERANIANKIDADVFISNHVNAGGGTGFESFIYNKPSAEAITLQKDVNEVALSVLKKYGLGAHGEDKKRANLAVVRETKMPAILTEMCFIDSNDANLLKKDEFLQEMAAAYAQGVAKFLGLKAKDQITSESVKIQTGGLTPNKLKDVAEFLLEKKWYAEITFTGEGNPKVVTGGLSEKMQLEFESWLIERNWFYKIIK